VVFAARNWQQAEDVGTRAWLGSIIGHELSHTPLSGMPRSPAARPKSACCSPAGIRRTTGRPGGADEQMSRSAAGSGLDPSIEPFPVEALAVELDVTTDIDLHPASAVLGVHLSDLRHLVQPEGGLITRGKELRQ
jgi:hypothetical protein